jgi:hypothetical protein
MSQFRVEMGSHGNGRKNPSPIFVNTETGPCKYGNERTKVKNGTGRNDIFSVRFQRYIGGQRGRRQVEGSGASWSG